MEKVGVSRIVKCAISVAFYVVLRCGDLLRALAGASRGKCMVLYYHSVPPEQRARFAAQLDVIQRHVRVLDVTGPVVMDPRAKCAGITFDDGFENYVQQALPELLQRNMRSTMFIVSDALGKSFGPAGNPEKVMSADQLRALPQDLVTIGSHTISHPFLPELNATDARRELQGSKASIERLLQREIPTFSFPFGGFSESLVNMCREVGYRRVFTTLPAFAFGEGSDAFAVGRIRVDPTDWPLEFRLKLMGAYNWLPLAFALKRRLRSSRSVPARASTPAAERSMVRE